MPALISMELGLVRRWFSPPLPVLLLVAANAFGQSKTAYVEQGFASFEPHQSFRSVGVFGSFGKGTELQERDHVGLSAFTLRKDAPENTMVWANFVDGKDLVLGRAQFPGTLAKKQFEFLDWTTGRLNFTTIVGEKNVPSEAYFSRSFPGTLYVTDAEQWSWKAADIHFDRAAYRNASGQVVVCKPGATFGRLGAPWVVVWAHPVKGSDVIPVLVRFEKQPKLLSLGKNLNAEFNGAANSIVVMPLYGIHRFKPEGGSEWNDSIPQGAIAQAEFWSRASAAYPTGIREHYAVSESRQIVNITDEVDSRWMADDWKTTPLILTPVSPVTAIAEANGYPVKWLSKVSRSPLATLLGPFAYTEGSEVSYEIPLATAGETMLAPIQIVGDSKAKKYRDRLNQLAADYKIKPDDTSDGGLNLQLKEFSQAFPLFDRSTKDKLAPQMESAFDAAYDAKNLQTVTDPVTGQRYVMCNKIWCVGEPYDREWYTGRQLDFTSEYGAWVDPMAIKPHWKAIQGLYAYYQIYNDWAWSGTLSSVFAYALCADGMNFAMEGMLGVARMARQTGDQNLYFDASYRAAKEALCTYGSWFMTDFVKQQDYVTWTDTSYDHANKKGRYEIHRMAPKDAQTGFGLDIFSDTTGVKIFRNGSFWHATAAVYWNNPSLLRLYDETLYPKVFKWEYETLATLHPNWLDGKAIEYFSNQPYGNNFVIDHLDARAVLFGDSAEKLEPLMNKLLPDIAFLYKLRAATDLAEAGAPQVWAPTGQAIVDSVEWDAAKKLLTVKLEAAHSVDVSLDWNWRSRSAPSPKPTTGPKPARVTAADKAGTYHAIKGGFFRLPLQLEGGKPTTVRIQY